MRNFVIGDIHSSFGKLMNVIEYSGFSNDDNLYFTGDICDRGDNPLETIKFLMSLKNRFKPCFGNHDVWLYSYLNRSLTKEALNCWKHNGGSLTIKNIKKPEEKIELLNWLGKFKYSQSYKDIIISHNITDTEYKNNTLKYYIDNHIIDDVYDDGMFGRNLFDSIYYGYTKISKSFERLHIIGHTPMTDSKIFYNKDYKVIDVDTAGFCNKHDYGIDGCLTLLDLDTMEWYNSNKDKGTIEL